MRTEITVSITFGDEGNAATSQQGCSTLVSDLSLQLANQPNVIASSTAACDRPALDETLRHFWYNCEAFLAEAVQGVRIGALAPSSPRPS
jgi:hypothetical protein